MQLNLASPRQAMILPTTLPTAGRLAACLALLTVCAPAEDVPLYKGTSVRLASQEQTTELLAARDEFALRLSRFDRQSRMQTNEEVTLDDWLKFNATHARSWSEAEAARVKAAVEELRPRLEPFSLPLPEIILLARTSGREEGNAAYTRGSTIFLPDRVMAYPRADLQKLLVHELFHVLSRHDPTLRQKLYAIVGFHPCDPIKLPPSWEDRRITNPDAPLVDCYMELSIDGRQITAAPLLYASVARYDPKSGGSFFQYLTFRMLILSRDGPRWTASVKEDRPVVFDPRQVEAFYEKVGRNTSYIVHPDEILADNFALLVQGQKEVPTPRILDEMRKLLEK
jgi:hypothetical protein